MRVELLRSSRLVFVRLLELAAELERDNRSSSRLVFVRLLEQSHLRGWNYGRSSRLVFVRLLEQQRGDEADVAVLQPPCICAVTRTDWQCLPLRNLLQPPCICAVALMRIAKL